MFNKAFCSKYFLSLTQTLKLFLKNSHCACFHFYYYFLKSRKKQIILKLAIHSIKHLVQNIFKSHYNIFPYSFNYLKLPSMMGKSTGSIYRSSIYRIFNKNIEDWLLYILIEVSSFIQNTCKILCKNEEHNLLLMLNIALLPTELNCTYFFSCLFILCKISCDSFQNFHSSLLLSDIL